MFDRSHQPTIWVHFICFKAFSISLSLQNIGLRIILFFTTCSQFSGTSVCHTFKSTDTQTLYETIKRSQNPHSKKILRVCVNNFFRLYIFFPCGWVYEACVYDVFFISYAHHTVYANVVFVFCWTIGDDAIATRKEYLALSMLKKKQACGRNSSNNRPECRKKMRGAHFFWSRRIFSRFAYYNTLSAIWARCMCACIRVPVFTIRM